MKPPAWFAAPRSLRFQLLARSLLILAALLVLVGALQYVLVQHFLYENRAETMAAQIHGLPRDLLERAGLLPERREEDEGNRPDGGREPNPAGYGRLRGPLVLLSDTSMAYVTADGEFRDLADGDGLPAPRLEAADYRELHAALRSGRVADYRVVKDDHGTEQLLVFRLAEGPAGLNGLIQMGTSTAGLDAVVLRQLLIYVGLAALALAGGIALYLPVLRRTLGPLQAIMLSVERTDAGNLDIRFPARQGQLEIDRLADAFNAMLERLKVSFEAEREAKEQMRRFIADASHELRTPLTSINGFLEVLLRGNAYPQAQLEAALLSMQGESRRLTKLVEDLLTLAKLDRAPQLQIRMVETPLDTLLLEMEPHLRILAGSREVRFDLAPGVRGMLDPDKIKQVVLNLFHNAVQHTDPAQGRIALRLSADADAIELQIADNGTGIAPEHLPLLFERFYRIDTSRVRKQGGAGLGLAISRSIVEAHGGRIAAASEPGRGSTFTVLLPASPARAAGRA